LLILDNNYKANTWFTSANSIEEVIKLVVFEDQISHQYKIYYTTSVDASNFMPEFYNGESKKIDSILDKYETKKLYEIAELFTGKSVPIEELGGNEGEFSYLRARNLIGGRIVPSEYVRSEFVEKYARQILFPGDILV